MRHGAHQKLFLEKLVYFPAIIWYYLEYNILLDEIYGIIGLPTLAEVLL